MWNWRSAPQPPIPIYVAALNPRMLQLAGEVADGVLLNWIPEEQVPWALGHLKRGAGKAGRTLDDLDIACLVRVCVTDDINTARQWLRRELTGYAIVEAYERYFRQIGFEPEVVAVLAKWRAGDRSGAVEGVSDDMTDRLAVFGSAAQCQVRLERYVRAGVNLPIIFPFSPEADFQTSIYRTLTKLGPGQSGRRPTTAS